MKSAAAEIDPDSFDASFLFCIIGEKTRLQIMRLLMGSPRDVKSLKKALKIEATLLSKHLKALRMCGLVLSNRKGRHITYCVNPKITRRNKKYSLFLSFCEIKLNNIGLGNR